MLTFIEKYKELRREGIRPDQCKIIAESYVSRETLRKLDAERVPLNDVRDMVFHEADVILRSTCDRFKVRVAAVHDEDWSLGDLMPDVTTQHCNRQFEGWGHDGQERGEFALNVNKSTLCVDLGERLRDILKYAPSGMSKQVKREWAVGALNDRKERVEDYFNDEWWAIGIRVTVDSAPDEYADVVDTVEASLWGLDVSWQRDIDCLNYLQEVCEGLLDEVGHQLDEITTGSKAA